MCHDFRDSEFLQGKTTHTLQVSHVQTPSQQEEKKAKQSQEEREEKGNMGLS
jgi:hypothetical protein